MDHSPKLKIAKPLTTPWAILSDPEELKTKADHVARMLLKTLSAEIDTLAILPPAKVKNSSFEDIPGVLESFYKFEENFLRMIIGSVLKTAMHHKRYVFCMSATTIVKILKADPDLPKGFLNSFNLVEQDEVMKKRDWANVVHAAEQRGWFRRIGRPAVGCATAFEIMSEDIALIMANRYNWSQTWESIYQQQKASAIEFSQGAKRQKIKITLPEPPTEPKAQATPPPSPRKGGFSNMDRRKLDNKIMEGEGE